MYHKFVVGSSDMFAIAWTCSAHDYSLALVALTVCEPFFRISFSSDTIHSPCHSAQEGPLHSAVGACGP
jgi:hypothetical protein